jgi:hypothetical protein
MKIFISLFAGAILFAACSNNSNKQGDATAKETPAPSSEESIQTINPAFSNLDDAVSVHIKSIFDQYFVLNAALVNSSPEEARAGADALLQTVRRFDKSLLPAEQKPEYDKSMGSIRASLNKIAATADLEKQRAHFAALSTKAYELAKSFDAGKTVYRGHCPMALDDKGAMWLSESKEIKNPYYGEKMLECGTVEEVIANKNS